MLTAERLREVLAYNPETGVFTRRVAAGRCGRWKAGSSAGTPMLNGYTKIYLDGRQHYAHRLAWLYMTGAWPKNQVDHLDGQRDRNVWSNLREASHTENARNIKVRSDSTSGLKGVRRASSGSRWVAQIAKAGRRAHLGTFDTPEEAHAAYIAAAKELHGEFASSRVCSSPPRMEQTKCTPSQTSLA
jgi:hypothetical protein